MANTLRETTVTCPICGHNFWIFNRTVYNMTTQKDEQQDQDAFCPKCEKGKFMEALKTAHHIKKLAPEEESVNNAALKATNNLINRKRR